MSLTCFVNHILHLSPNPFLFLLDEFLCKPQDKAKAFLCNKDKDIERSKDKNKIKKDLTKKIG